MGGKGVVGFGLEWFGGDGVSLTGEKTIHVIVNGLRVFVVFC